MSPTFENLVSIVSESESSKCMRCKCFSYIFPFDTVLCPGVLGTVQWKEREASIKSGTQLNSAERNTLPDSTAVRLSCAEQGCITCGSLAAGLQENGERMRKWKENEEMERDSLFTFPHYVFFPPSNHFWYKTLSHFVAKCQIRHLSWMSHKTYHTCSEKTRPRRRSPWHVRPLRALTIGP